MIITVDFETFYTKEYSLRRMSEVDYILDPRFEVILCAVKMGDAPTRVYTNPREIRAAIASIDWENNALLAHNTRFDGSILAWHYDVTPGIYLDTLSMARALTHAYTGSSALEKVARYLGLPPKGDAVVRAEGKTRADFTPDELAEYVDYCAHDTDLCRMVFDRFQATDFPKSELLVIDLALRMFLEPQAVLNPNKLAEQLNLVRAEKAAAFAQLAHIEKDRFSSNNKFAALLQSYNVNVPRKISPTTGEWTWALARNDREFKELCADPNQKPIVQAALACRLGAKSTIDETRTATLLNLSQRSWGARGAGWMPVPYKYYAAHTGRFGGDGGYNFANLRRNSPIRDAIEAPPGYRVVHRDSSQIEARLVAWLAGCHTLTYAFAEGRDVYCEFASQFYGRTITKADKLERFTGKQAVLSLGYGAGAAKFRHSLFIGQGGMSVDLTDEDADRLVKFYRDTYREIPRLWWKAKSTLERMIKRPNTITVDTMPPLEVGTECIYLPNGLAMQYPNLRVEPNDGEMYFDGAYGKRKIYGAKLIENCTQALARIVVTDIMLRVHQATGFHPCMSTYDSHDYIVPEGIAEEFDVLLEHEFGVVPAWAQSPIPLPLASEGGFGKTLLEAERGVNQ
jgi:DNA polymerase